MYTVRVQSQQPSMKVSGLSRRAKSACGGCAAVNAWGMLPSCHASAWGLSPNDALFIVAHEPKHFWQMSADSLSSCTFPDGHDDDSTWPHSTALNHSHAENLTAGIISCSLTHYSSFLIGLLP